MKNIIMLNYCAMVSDWMSKQILDSLGFWNRIFTNLVEILFIFLFMY